MSILLVDDEVALTDPLSRALRREGYAVDVAHDGEAALGWIQHHQESGSPYGLLILDWMLPRQSGPELCRMLRSQGNITPVLFLTAKDTIDERVQGLDAGADDYLVKPFELKELLARVRALLRRGELLMMSVAPSDPAQQNLQAEGVELDLDNQVAYHQGRIIDLSEKECRLLAFLMQHPQQLLSHEAIYSYVWPTEEKPTSNVLAAHIRLLRRKLEGPKDLPLIHTVYGKGYRFGTNRVES
jgi:two-component system, OmpR family, manganese sensing response regulator